MADNNTSVTNSDSSVIKSSLVVLNIYNKKKIPAKIRLTDKNISIEIKGIGKYEIPFSSVIEYNLSEKNGFYIQITGPSSLIQAIGTDKLFFDRLIKTENGFKVLNQKDWANNWIENINFKVLSSKSNDLKNIPQPSNDQKKPEIDDNTIICIGCIGIIILAAIFGAFSGNNSNDSSIEVIDTTIPTTIPTLESTPKTPTPTQIALEPKKPLNYVYNPSLARSYSIHKIDEANPMPPSYSQLAEAKITVSDSYTKEEIINTLIKSVNDISILYPELDALTVFAYYRKEDIIAGDPWQAGVIRWYPNGDTVIGRGELPDTNVRSNYYYDIDVNVINQSRERPSEYETTIFFEQKVAVRSSAYYDEEDIANIEDALCLKYGITREQLKDIGMKYNLYYLPWKTEQFFVKYEGT